ncbi:MAG: hypothetical protein FWD55_02160, partial [Propionibacteriaceae bacterium]|nr:hypothetical protein [Propionibacteriaceae bacterium]
MLVEVVAAQDGAARDEWVDQGEQVARGDVAGLVGLVARGDGAVPVASVARGDGAVPVEAVVAAD